MEKKGFYVEADYDESKMALQEVFGLTDGQLDAALDRWADLAIGGSSKSETLMQLLEDKTISGGMLLFAAAAFFGKRAESAMKKRALRGLSSEEFLKIVAGEAVLKVERGRAELVPLKEGLAELASALEHEHDCDACDDYDSCWLPIKKPRGSKAGPNGEPEAEHD